MITMVKMINASFFHIVTFFFFNLGELVEFVQFVSSKTRWKCGLQNLSLRTTVN